MTTAKCSQCQKELIIDEVRYHSKIVNNTVEHVWCDAECSHRWHQKHKRPQNTWPSHLGHGG